MGEGSWERETGPPAKGCMGTQLKAGESTELTSIYPIPAPKLHVTHTRLQ